MMYFKTTDGGYGSFCTYTDYVVYACINEIGEKVLRSTRRKAVEEIPKMEWELGMNKVWNEITKAALPGA